MNRKIHGRQCGALVLLFLTGWSLTLPAGSRDGWIAILLAAGLSLLFFALSCFPSERIGGTLSAVLKAVYGTVGGTILLWALCALAFWGLCMSSLSFVIFLRTVSEEIWPIWLIAAFFLLVTALIAHGGLSRMALWAAPMAWVVLAALVLSLALTLPDSDWREVLPLLENKSIAEETWYALAAPFAECWFVIALLGGQSENTRSGCLAAAVIGGVLLAATALRNLTVLGQSGAQAVWYPSYTAAGLIEIGKSFQRGEVLVSGSLLLCSVARAAVFLCFLSDGLTVSLPSLPRRAVTGTAAAACLAVCILTAGSTGNFQRAELLYRSLLLPILLLVAGITAVGTVWRTRKSVSK
jgi:hypothetical protein